MLSSYDKVVEPFKKPGHKKERSPGSSNHENSLLQCKLVTKIFRCQKNIYTF